MTRPSSIGSGIESKAREAVEPVILDEAEMARVLELFKGYGQVSYTDGNNP